ncbi:Di-sulfide bridge nucleocytoplasmic transport domain-containing protein [Gilbertella persicaria]|uniref:Di-sulfide bridge nucleocytoplasmic transport domain-containing protein n=1 Tax=Gilbertella persicaria TaxID=101096 RepID=UPI002220BB38|nr:Di-sulfide bridge nucleocytoplasmic transport domain-containing protein [Gilbertella persicaria]KAI8085833.1 Di-sulfide bridge nucleocytoplasmic transport domain-containing protein [Gilbertella persicaria]
MLGRKRSRVDQEEHSHEERRIAPRDYNFNFIPTLQPKQNKHTPSVSTLTQRFKSRLNEYKPTKPPTTAIAPEPAFIKHQLISYTILIYMQTIFNVVVSMTVLYIFGKIMFAIKQDFRLKTQEHINVLHKERLACTNHYFINHCQDDHRIPAIEDMCNTWEACMNRDIVVAQ